MLLLAFFLTLFLSVTAFAEPRFEYSLEPGTGYWRTQYGDVLWNEPDEPYVSEYLKEHGMTRSEYMAQLSSIYGGMIESTVVDDLGDHSIALPVLCAFGVISLGGAVLVHRRRVTIDDKR